MGLLTSSFMMQSWSHEDGAFFRGFHWILKGQCHEMFDLFYLIKNFYLGPMHMKMAGLGIRLQSLISLKSNERL